MFNHFFFLVFVVIFNLKYIYNHRFFFVISCATRLVYPFLPLHYDENTFQHIYDHI